ncbi:uncharacterized protein [Muntiacus reevesi]|uniref:uncharacterized protein n=1 Tax=Muntiacus reevesi TaxID=9886 RepID=UPI003306F8BA
MASRWRCAPMVAAARGLAGDTEVALPKAGYGHPWACLRRSGSLTHGHGSPPGLGLSEAAVPGVTRSPAPPTCWFRAGLSEVRGPPVPPSSVSPPDTALSCGDGQGSETRGRSPVPPVGPRSPTCDGGVGVQGSETRGRSPVPPVGPRSPTCDGGVGVQGSETRGRSPVPPVTGWQVISAGDRLAAREHRIPAFPDGPPRTLVSGSGHSKALQTCIFNRGVFVLKTLTEMVPVLWFSGCGAPGFGEGAFRIQNPLLGPEAEVSPQGLWLLLEGRSPRAEGWRPGTPLVEAADAKGRASRAPRRPQSRAPAGAGPSRASARPKGPGPESLKWARGDGGKGLPGRPASICPSRVRVVGPPPPRSRNPPGTPPPNCSSPRPRREAEPGGLVPRSAAAHRLGTGDRSPRPGSAPPRAPPGPRLRAVAGISRSRAGSGSQPPPAPSSSPPSLSLPRDPPLLSPPGLSDPSWTFPPPLLRRLSLSFLSLFLSVSPPASHSLSVSASPRVSLRVSRSPSLRASSPAPRPPPPVRSLLVRSPPPPPLAAPPLAAPQSASPNRRRRRRRNGQPGSPGCALLGPAPSGLAGTASPPPPALGPARPGPSPAPERAEDVSPARLSRRSSPRRAEPERSAAQPRALAGSLAPAARSRSSGAPTPPPPHRRPGPLAAAAAAARGPSPAGRPRPQRR